MSEHPYRVDCRGKAPPADVADDEKRFRELWDCYSSEQICEAAWQEHLRMEPGLADYARVKGGRMRS